MNLSTFKDKGAITIHQFCVAEDDWLFLIFGCDEVTRFCYDSVKKIFKANVHFSF